MDKMKKMFELRDEAKQIIAPYLTDASNSDLLDLVDFVVNRSK